jgi:predicted transposase/invertase (TIGR01784 family)
MPFKARKAILARLEEVASLAALSPENRNKYQYTIDNLNVHLGMINGAELKGMEKGMEKGLEQGREQGMEQEKKNVARRMKQRGLSPNDIMEFTGLSREQIEQL